jgi:hypothetical protein
VLVFGKFDRNFVMLEEHHQGGGTTTVLGVNLVSLAYQFDFVQHAYAALPTACSSLTMLETNDLASPKSMSVLSR